MANAGEILSRMKSIQDTMKITNAMYMISSSKLKKAKKMEEDARAHFTAVQDTINNIMNHMPDMEHEFIEDKKVRKACGRKAFIVITADKGLAGAYNHNVIKSAVEDIKKADENYYLVIGRAGRHFFEKHGIKTDENFKGNIQNPDIGQARNITEIIIGRYRNREYDEVYIVFTEMINAVKSLVHTVKLLPLERRADKADERFEENMEYVPLVKAVIDNIVPNYITGYIYGAMVEAFLSEQNSRMTAMQSSTENAAGMLDELRREYNRTRQDAITQEISEVVGGAKALRRKKDKSGKSDKK